MIFQFASVFLFYIAMERGTISKSQCALQLVLFVMYIAIVYLQDKIQK